MRTLYVISPVIILLEVEVNWDSHVNTVSLSSHVKMFEAAHESDAFTTDDTSLAANSDTDTLT